MNITFGKAIENILSEKYNKINLLIYLLIAGAVMIPYMLNIVPVAIIPLLLILIFMFVSWGFLFKSYNNAIRHYREGVFPNIFSDFGKIFPIGFKHFFGMILSALAFIGLPMIPVAVVATSLMFVNPVFIIVGAILYVLAFLVLLINYICVFSNVCISLKWNDWFNLKKATFLRKKATAKNFALYRMLWRLIVLQLLTNGISFVIGFIGGFTSGVSPQQQVSTSVSVFIMLISIAISALSLLISIDLTAQMINEVFPNLGKRKPQPVQHAE